MKKKTETGMEWILLTRDGETTDSSHTDTELGFEVGGGVKWRRIRYVHPKLCQACRTKIDGRFCSGCGKAAGGDSVVAGYGAGTVKSE